LEMREDFGVPCTDGRPSPLPEYRNPNTEIRNNIEFQIFKIPSGDAPEVLFSCSERAPACFNARGWILTTDFTAPSWTLHPKVLNELHSQNRRRLSPETATL